MNAVPPWFALLAAIIVAAVASSKDTECAEEDLQMMMQTPQRFVRPTAASKSSILQMEPCPAAVPWPCDNDLVSSFALQVINNVNGGDVNAVCEAGEGTAQIKRLDLNTGTYNTLCNVVGVCLNACGIHPQTNLVYCNHLPGSNNLVRVDCDLNITDLENRNQQGTLADAAAPNGTVCYLGRLPRTFAGNLDVEGEYWFKEDSGPQESGDLYRITNGTLDSLEPTGQTDPFTTGPFIPGAGDGEEVVGRPGLANMADFVVVKENFPQLTVGEQTYVVGCFSNLVYVQQVSGDLTNVDPIVLTMRDIDPPPGQGTLKDSGAQWLFNGTIYCAYNDGTSGVVEIQLPTAILDPGDLNVGTVRAVRVSDSVETSSNDGMNCLLAESPFPPSPTSTTSATSSSSSSSSSTTSSSSSSSSSSTSSSSSSSSSSSTTSSSSSSSSSSTTSSSSSSSSRSFDPDVTSTSTTSAEVTLSIPSTTTQKHRFIRPHNRRYDRRIRPHNRRYDRRIRRQHRGYRYYSDEQIQKPV